MANIDKNIDAYDLEKLLQLFDLDSSFDSGDLKVTKKKVLMLHPDKSGLDTETFLFFVQAYKKLELIYNFIKKANSEAELSKQYDQDETLKAYLDRKQINSYENEKEFLREFNRMFDEVYIKDDEEGSGYEEWLKSNENMYDKNDIEKSRRQIVMVREKVNEYDSTNNGNAYFDVKEAYSKSIFDIDAKKEYENKEKFSSIEHLKRHRHTQDIDPMALKQSQDYLENKERMLKNNAMNMAYNILEKQTKMEKKMNDYASKFLMIDHK